MLNDRDCYILVLSNGDKFFVEKDFIKNDKFYKFRLTEYRYNYEKYLMGTTVEHTNGEINVNEDYIIYFGQTWIK